MSLSLGFFIVNAKAENLRDLAFLATVVVLLAAMPLSGEELSPVRLMSSGRDGLVFEFLAAEASVVNLPGEGGEDIFQLLSLPGCDMAVREGIPMLPMQAVNIGLPPQAAVSFSILEDEFEELQDVFLAPGPRAFRGEGEDASFYETVYQPDRKVYQADAFFPAEICVAQQVALLRHQRVSPLVLYPVQFNPVTRTVRIHRRIVVQVKFSPSSPEVEQESGEDLFERVYRFSLLNYEQARNWRTRSPSFTRGTIRGDDPFCSSDDWFKISLRLEGICRLTSTQLSQAGLDLSVVDPETIKIYNIGCKILPRQVGNPPTMVEIPISISGQDDGRLDPEDEILFYATDLSGWEEMSEGGYSEYANPYTDLNVYWLTYGGQPGRRMESRPGAAQSTTYIQAERFRTTAHQERDYLNTSYSGLTWYWDSMTGYGAETEEHRVTLGGVADESCRLKVRVKGIYYKSSGSIPSSIPHHVYFYLNDSPYPTIERLWYGAVAIVADGEADGLQEGENTLKIVLPRVECEWDHILFDWFEIEYWRGYQVVEDQLHFSSPDTSGIIQYDLAGFSEAQIVLLDVSDPYMPVRITDGSVFFQEDHYTLRFQENLSVAEPRRYYVATPQTYVSPISVERRIPANLREVSADLIMVTPRAFQESLEPLVNLHRQEGMRVVVATIEDVYDRFAWGLVDPTAIRDYLWFAYNQRQVVPPAYILLFGDGNFDYKNNSGAGGSNLIPPYEMGDLCTDDWFVRLDGDYLADMMIGRLPVRSGEEAGVVVGKITDYVLDPFFGPWRNRVMIVSDDETATNGEGNELFHTRDSEDLARNFIPPSYDQHKVYLTEYPMNWSNKKPEAQQAVIDGFNEGMLVVNWIGHGNFDVWAHEDAFRGSNDIPRLTNGQSLPLVYSASCDVGRFDHTLNESMSEELLRVKDGGAVATIGATRYCYATPNAELNKEFLRLVLGNEDLTLGEGLFGAKLSRPNSYSNDQKYALFGDPCMRLGRPALESQITSMSRDTLKALDRVTVQGQVFSQGVPDTTFQGSVSLRVFDSARATTYTTKVGSKVYYLLPGATIFRGSCLMEDGHFEATFVVPKDISYGGRMARISAYLNDQSRDGLAYLDSLPVQGTASAVEDTIGPAIELSIAGKELAPGDLVPSNSTIVAYLEDENGINITGEVGHWIVLTVDEDAQRVNVTDRFNYDPGSYQRGMLNYTLEGLSVGSHTLTMKAWDNFNNFSTVTLHFEVVEEGELFLCNVLNCPNPFNPRSENTRFTYQLSYPARVTIRIYTVAGRLIRTLEQGEIAPGYNESQPWEGEDQDGDRVANGVYLYKIIACAEGKRTEAYGKVVVMR